jgi:NADPH:quinone reductase-like Zn-dependent oxidoreductase
MARVFGLVAIGTIRGNSPAGLFGARLLNARSPSLVDEVRKLTGGGVRAVFDSSAGRSLWRSRAMVQRGGALVVFGLTSVAERSFRATWGTVGSLASLALFRILPGKRSTVFATDRIYRSEPARVRAWVSRTLELLAVGKIAPVIGATLPLERVSEAHRLLETRAIVGKVVLDCR